MSVLEDIVRIARIIVSHPLAEGNCAARQSPNDVVGAGKARQGYCSGNCNLSQSVTLKGGNRQWLSIELFLNSFKANESDF